MSHTGGVLRAALIVATAAAAFAATAGGAERHPQHDVVAASHGRTVRATLGTNCTPAAGRVRCTDRSYPLRTRKRLPTHDGGRIVLEFKRRPEEIDAQLRDRRSRPVYELKAPRGRGLRRTIRLPGTMPAGSDRLGFFVRYERGDADFEVDIKRHRHS
jgi:hypothetical protein